MRTLLTVKNEIRAATLISQSQTKPRKLTTQHLVLGAHSTHNLVEELATNLYCESSHQ